MSDTDNDPRWIAAAIDREQQTAREIQTRALDNQAHAIGQLVETMKFTSKSIIDAVTSNDLSLLEQKNSFPQKGTGPEGKLIA